MPRQLIEVCKRELLGMYKHAIEAVKPDNLLRKSVAIDQNLLLVKDPLNLTSEPLKIDLKDRNIHIIGGGKCVLGMAKGLAELCKQANLSENIFSHGCLSLPIGLKSTYFDDNAMREHLNMLDIKCLFGSKDNLPDEDSVLASKDILHQIIQACRRDRAEMRRSLFIVLISGGGSACLTAPRLINLNEKVELIKRLTQKGANIVELNKVRMFFSHIKGGNLARHIMNNNAEAQILTFILSDVIGDPIEYIASGPTVIGSGSNEDHYETMMQVVNKYGLDKEICKMISKLNYELAAGVRGNGQELRFVDCIYNRIIGNNKIALSAAIELAKQLGYSVVCLSDCVQGLSQDVVNEMIEFSSNQLAERASSGLKKELVICGGETTVNKNPGESWGKGGRAQEMVLDYMISKLTNVSGSSLNDIDLFLAGATDGQDGPTEVAGCLGSLAELKLCSAGLDLKLEDVKRAKELHDSYNFWLSHKPDWLIKTGITGTNVMDLYLHLRVNTSVC